MGPRSLVSEPRIRGNHQDHQAYRPKETRSESPAKMSRRTPLTGFRGLPVKELPKRKHPGDKLELDDSEDEGYMSAKSS